MTKTISDRLAGLDDERAKLDRRIEAVRRIYTALPGGLDAPTVSNETDAGAWISWHRPYSHDPAYDSSAVLGALEAAGWEPLAATLCRWDDYRPSPEPGHQEDIPDTKHRYTLTDTWPIAPLWIVLNQHTGTEAVSFYRQEGRVYRVRVPGPSSASITARRKEPRGTWYYEHGTARLLYPESWHGIGPIDGDNVIGIAAQSRAFVDTEQGISGAIYFDPFVDPFPFTPAQILSWLLR